MAYVYRPDQNKDEKDQQAGPITIGGQQGSSLPGGGQGPVQARPTSSGRFTNLQGFLKANRGNQLGQNLQQNIAGQTEKAGQRVEEAKTGFQQQQQQAWSPFQGGEQFAQQVIQNAPTAVSDQDQFNRFQQIRQAQYGGPQDISNYSGLRQGVQNVRDLAGLGNTEAGRFALLKNAFGGGKQYNRGQQTLDQLLLQGQTGALSGLKRTANQGLQNLEKTRGQLQGEYATNLQKAQELAKNVTGQLGTATGQTEQEIAGQLAKAQAYEEQQRRAQQDIQSLLRGQGLQEVSVGGQQLRAGQSAKSKIDDLNQALKIATEAGILKQGDPEAITNLYTRLNTPVDQVIAQAAKSGAKDLFGWTKPGQRDYYNLLKRQSSLDFGQMLSDALRTQDASNVTKYGVASPEEIARANALAKLSGSAETPYDPNAERYRSSTSAFDLDTLQKRINKELADLAQVQQLPDEYQETPLSEKLKYTFAPTNAEISEDIKTDMGILSDSGSPMAQKLLASARLGLASPRSIIGGVVNPLVGSIGTQMDALKSGNVGDILSSGASSAVNIPLGITGGAVSAPMMQVGSMLENAPILKDIGGTALGGALSSVGNAINQATSGVGNFIGGIFCYAAGTPIRMANGSYKNVDKLKIGDKLYLGGAVTGTGEVLEKSVYKYKGTVVSGNHAVYENGRFYRVMDCPGAESLNKTMKVYPVVTENHLMVTKTHIGTDFAETDEGTHLTPEQRLEKLNNDRKLLRNLRLKNELLFKDKKDGNKEIRD